VREQPRWSVQSQALSTSALLRYAMATAAALRAAPVMMASSSVTWRRALPGARGGAARVAACPSPSLPRRWALRQSARSPAAFRLFASSSDSDAGPTSDDGRACQILLWLLYSRPPQRHVIDTHFDPSSCCFS
jgi:hypothetical protein